MAYLIETENYRGYEINIYYDEDPINPREDDNFDKIICKQGRYILGDETYSNTYANSWKEWFAYYVVENYSLDVDLVEYDMFGYFSDDDEVDKVWSWIDKNMIVFRVWIYDHSGVVIGNSSVDNGPSGWDYSTVGFQYMTKKKAIELFGNKNFTKKVLDAAEEFMNCTIENYNKYISGEVYMFEIKDDFGFVDDEGGFYDQDVAMERAKEIVNFEIDLKKKNHFKKLKTWIKHKVPFSNRHKLNLI